ncbi:HlyD family secretion protein, partial [Undibacterium sp.]|uniref:HlyD family secretion protein n=1 Tax=Undibacterium sp. TaxID=1914977 RepID=UPI00375031B2
VTAKNITAPELTLEGEVLSRQSQVISPPTIRNVWNFNLVMLAAEGSHVKVGEPVAIFEANDAKTKLDTHRSSLKEKQRSVEKTTLDHAEAAKAADLAVSEAKSNAEKALRKASLPKELVKRIDYDKLVIERDLFTQLAGLSERQRDAQQRARTAELRGLKSEIAQLLQTISILEKGLNGLTVIAPRAGTVVHNVGFDDEKFAVGSRVFMGAAVANLADPEKIFVAAKVPEAQVALVKLGQLVSVTTPGSNTQIAAKISGFGPVFHGKSANQPMIVRDIEIEFDSLPKNLKPGTAVQVKIVNQTASKSAIPPGAPVGVKK